MRLFLGINQDARGRSVDDVHTGEYTGNGMVRTETSLNNAADQELYLAWGPHTTVSSADGGAAVTVAVWYVRAPVGLTRGPLTELHFPFCATGSRIARCGIEGRRLSLNEQVSAAVAPLTDPTTFGWKIKEGDPESNQGPQVLLVQGDLSRRRDVNLLAGGAFVGVVGAAVFEIILILAQAGVRRRAPETPENDGPARISAPSPAGPFPGATRVPTGELWRSWKQKADESRR